MQGAAKGEEKNHTAKQTNSKQTTRARGKQA
jgi:hypothetical protein